MTEQEQATQSKTNNKEKFLSFSITNILNESSSDKSVDTRSKEGNRKLSSSNNESEENVSMDEADEDIELNSAEESEIDVTYDEDDESSQTEQLEDGDFQKSPNNGIVINESTGILNKESLIKFCQNFGLEEQSSALMNHLENNKFLFKHLFQQPVLALPTLTSVNPTQPTSSLYNSFLSSWLSSFNSLSDLETSKANNLSQNEKVLELKGPIIPKRMGHPYQNRNPPKRKKPRTSFNRPQIVELEKRFMKQKYLASSERSSLAKVLKMTDAQVKTWFQNRRTKWRRQNAEEMEAERQAANKLIMSLKQQSEMSSLNTNIIQPLIQSPNSTTVAKSDSLENKINTLAALATSKFAPSDESKQNPLNKLIMMEMALSAEEK